MDINGITKQIDNEAEWRKYLVARFDELCKEVKSNRAAIVGLQVKAGIWGLLAGLIPVMILLIIKVCQ